MNRRTAPASAVNSGLALLLVAVLMLVIAVAASGCTKGQQSLVGAWAGVDDGERLDFRADGTLYLTRASGSVETLSWRAEAGDLSIGKYGEDSGEDATFTYSIDDDVLTLVYGAEPPAKYTREQPQGG
jgi:hypothetical protein